MRIVLLQVIAQCMREREYIADAKACESGVSPEIMSATLKKVNSILVPKRRLFEQLLFVNAKGNHITDFQNKVNGFVGFLKGQASWHPHIMDRIHALKGAKYFLGKKKIEPMPLKDVAITTFLCTAFALIVGIWINVPHRDLEGNPSVLFLLLTLMFIPIMISMLSCMPLRFWDARTLEIAFIPGTPGSESEARALLLLLSLFYNKHWFKIHRNNLVSIAIVWVLVQPQLLVPFPFFLFLVSLIGCTGCCVIYIINCINSKYRAEKGITPIIR
ncbi:MAG: hypothetical protein AB1393_07650 [Candidatus Edwardsbacteria bacterium]